ncbi:MAG: DUF3429 domain-containing protein [Woeseiaceae bacterium]|nr:DUF3429 domain-containing protein [Woeseiaceae bacterium]
MQENKLYTLLTYAGAVPFVLCALLPFAGIDEWQNVGSFEYIARLYGLAIVSFVAGSHWGTYLYNREASPANLFLTSNAVVLAAWFAFLFTIPVLTQFVLLLAFLYLLFVDYNLHKAGLITPYYFRMRFTVTLIVGVSIAVMIFHLA